MRLIIFLSFLFLSLPAVAEIKKEVGAKENLSDSCFSGCLKDGHYSNVCRKICSNAEEHFEKRAHLQYGCYNRCVAGGEVSVMCMSRCENAKLELKDKYEHLMSPAIVVR